MITWTKDDIKILEERRTNYLSGKDKGMSIKEAKRRLKKKFAKIK